MTHPSESPEVVDAPAIDDDASALAALDTIFSDEAQEPVADEEPTGETDEGDEPETDEAEDGEDEADEPEAPAIEPPASLTAEEKAAWAQLPPEAQLMLKSVEARRTTETQRGLERAREAQRDAESAAAARVAEAQRLFAEQQAQLAQRYAPVKPNPAQFPDWHTYSAAQARYEAQVAQHESIVQQLTGLHEEASQEQQRLESESMRRMVAQVRDDVPEFADTAQFRELMDKLTPLAIELGYPEELLSDASPIDIRAIKRAAEWKADSDKYKALMARQMTKVRAGKSAKPNAAQPLGSGKARASQTAIQRLKQTGSDADALAALDSIFG